MGQLNDIEIGSSGLFIFEDLRVLRVNRAPGGTIEAIAEVRYRSCAPAEPENRSVFARVPARDPADDRPLRQRLTEAFLREVQTLEAEAFAADKAERGDNDRRGRP